MIAVEHFFRCSSEWHENKNAFAFLGKSDVAVHFLAASNLIPVSLTISLSSPDAVLSETGGKMQLQVISTCCKAPTVTITDQELQLLRTDSVLRGWRCAPRCLHLRHCHVNEEVKKGVMNGSSSLDTFASQFLSEQTDTLDNLLRRAHLPSCSSGMSLFHNELFLPGQSLSLFESPLIRTYCSALCVVQNNACESGSIGEDKGSSQKSIRWTLPRGWSAKSMSEAALGLHQTLFSSSWKDISTEGPSFPTGECKRLWTVEKCTLSPRSVFVFSKALIDVMNEEKIFHPLLHCTQLWNAKEADMSKKSGAPRATALPDKEEEDYRVTYLLTYLMALHGFELVESQPFLDHEPWKDSAWFAAHHFRCRCCGAHPKVESIEEVHESKENSYFTSFSVPQSDPLCPADICSESPKESETIDEMPSHVQASSLVGSPESKKRESNENEEVLLEESTLLAPGDNAVMLSPSLPLASSLFEMESTHPLSSHFALTFCWKKEYNSHCACCPWNSLFLSNILAPTRSQPTLTSPLEEVTLSLKKTTSQEAAAAETNSMQMTTSSRGMGEERGSEVETESHGEQHTLTFRFDSKELGYLLSVWRLREQLLNAAEKDLSMPLESTHPLLEITTNSLEVSTDIPIVANMSADLCDAWDSETRVNARGKGSRSDGSVLTDRLTISSPRLSREEVDRFLSHLPHITRDGSEPAKAVGTPGTENMAKSGDDCFFHHGSCRSSSSLSRVVRTMGDASEVQNNVESLTELIWETMYPMVLASTSSTQQKSNREELLYSVESSILDLPPITLDDEEDDKNSSNDEFRDKQCRAALELFETQWNQLEKLDAEGGLEEEIEKGNEDEKQCWSTDCILRHTYEVITSIGPLFLQTDAAAEALMVHASDTLKDSVNAMNEKETDIASQFEYSEGDRNFHESRIKDVEYEKKKKEINCISNLQRTSRKRGRTPNEDVSSDLNLYLSQLKEKIQQYRVTMAEKIIESAKQQEVAMEEQDLFSLRSVQKKNVGNDSQNTKRGEWISSIGKRFDHGPDGALMYACGGDSLSSSPAPNSSFLSTSSFPPPLPRSHLPHTSPSSPFPHRREIFPYPPNALNNMHTSSGGVLHSGNHPVLIPSPPFFTSSLPSSLSASDSGEACSPFQNPSTPSYPSSSLVSFPQSVLSAPVFQRSSMLSANGGSSRLSSSTSGALSSHTVGSVLGRQPASSILGAGHVSTGGPAPGRNRGGSRGRGEGGRGSGGGFRNDGTSGLGSGKLKALPLSGSGSKNTGFKGNVRRGGGIGGDGSSGLPRMDTSYGHSTNTGGGRGGRGQRSNRGGGG